MSGAGHPAMPDPAPIEACDACIRVVICDDHALFRRGLMMVLEEQGDIEVVAEAATGTEAVELVTHLTPDVVLMDVHMPEMDGLAATKAIVEALPTVNVVMLTVSDEEADLLVAMRAGAAGYLLKEISIDEVARAVRAVHRGERLVAPALAARLITALDRGGIRGLRRRRGMALHAEAPRLTPRELDVLQLIAGGATNREVARSLGLAENTVKNHVRNVLEKLQLHSRLEAVVYAVQAGLLPDAAGSVGGLPVPADGTP